MNQPNWKRNCTCTTSRVTHATLVSLFAHTPLTFLKVHSAMSGNESQGCKDSPLQMVHANRDIIVKGTFVIEIIIIRKTPFTPGDHGRW